IAVMQMPLEAGEHSVWFSLDGREFRTAPFHIAAGEQAELNLKVGAEGGVAFWKGQPLAVVALTTPRSDDGFVSLFDGSSLTGWKPHPDQPCNAKVEGSELVSEGAASQFYTERGDYENFRLRAEAMATGRGEILFRCGFGPQADDGTGRVLSENVRTVLDNVKATADAARARLQRLKAGHTPEEIAAAQQELDNAPENLKKAAQAKLDALKTGYPKEVVDEGLEEVQRVEANLLALSLQINSHKVLIRPGEWSKYEIIAEGKHITVKINGRVTADWLDENRTFAKGHIGLIQHDA